jgi:hypothetical protein
MQSSRVDDTVLALTERWSPITAAPAVPRRVAMAGVSARASYSRAPIRAAFRLREPQGGEFQGGRLRTAPHHAGRRPTRAAAAVAEAAAVAAVVAVAAAVALVAEAAVAEAAAAAAAAAALLPSRWATASLATASPAPA